MGNQLPRERQLRMSHFSPRIAVLFVLLSSFSPSHAWDYEGHRRVNQIALASLPTNFPSFIQTPEAKERIAFLSAEPDRWRNTPDLPLKHFNSPDHFLDIEDLILFGLDPKSLSPFRYEFTAQLAQARAANPGNFPPIDPAKNSDKTRELIGFLPWAITEHYGKLKSGFSYLKTFQENGGTPGEIANAEQNIIYIMGTMGHFVGDAGQPLHSTKHFNGWVGDNPKGYRTNSEGRAAYPQGLHSWIDGGFVAETGMTLTELLPRVRPAQFVWGNTAPRTQIEVFPIMMDYILDQHKLVELLYQLEKEGKLSGDSTKNQEGRVFIAKQFLVAGQMLGDLWYSAWHQAPEDTFLKAQLAKRQLKAQPVPQ
jgi:hypothetical protein